MRDAKLADVTKPAPLSDLPPAPRSSFASDNAAGVCDEVLAAMVAANSGPALAYGADTWTARALDDIRAAFGCDVESILCWGGTGANVVGLGTMVRPWEAIITVDTAHVVVDETGAPSRFTGSPILTVAHQQGKLTPAAIGTFAPWLGSEHHPQPKVATISQSTEMGTVYTRDEIAALADICHRHGMLLHLDGARIANALVATGDTLASMVVETGVDVMTFGFTKNGAMYGEAVVYVRPSLAEHARFVRKQAGQLVSKSRFAAAQVSAMLSDDVWLRNAHHANDMAALLAAAVADIPGITVAGTPQVNAVFARIPWDRLASLQEWSFFWPWNPSESLVRWMTGFQTSAEDVQVFADGLRQLLA